MLRNLVARPQSHFKYTYTVYKDARCLCTISMLLLLYRKVQCLDSFEYMLTCILNPLIYTHIRY